MDHCRLAWELCLQTWHLFMRRDICDSIGINIMACLHKNENRLTCPGNCWNWSKILCTRRLYPVVKRYANCPWCDSLKIKLQRYSSCVKAKCMAHQSGLKFIREICTTWMNHTHTWMRTHNMRAHKHTHKYTICIYIIFLKKKSYTYS